jgi:hypothetical protein
MALPGASSSTRGTWFEKGEILSAFVVLPYAHRAGDAGRRADEAVETVVARCDHRRDADGAQPVDRRLVGGEGGVAVGREQPALAGATRLAMLMLTAAIGKAERSA